MPVTSRGLFQISLQQQSLLESCESGGQNPVFGFSKRRFCVPLVSEQISQRNFPDRRDGVLVHVGGTPKVLEQWGEVTVPRWTSRYEAPGLCFTPKIPTDGERPVLSNEPIIVICRSPISTNTLYLYISFDQDGRLICLIVTKVVNSELLPRTRSSLFGELGIWSPGKDRGGNVNYKFSDGIWLIGAERTTKRIVADLRARDAGARLARVCIDWRECLPRWSAPWPWTVHVGMGSLAAALPTRRAKVFEADDPGLWQI